MRVYRYLGGVLAVAAMAVAGGAVSADSPEAAAEPQVFNVLVDGRVDEFNSGFFGFYPNHVTAHPGDTIVFTSVFTGEPHSIAFGSVIQPVIEGFMALTPEQMEFEGPPPPEVMELFELFDAIPPMLPEEDGDAIQSSVNPCFVAEGGELPWPDDPAAQCDVTEPWPFTGTEVFYNSGFLPDAMTFEMTLADDIEPGTYLGLCTLHFVEMIFALEVVPADVPTATPQEVAEEGLAQLEADAAAALPVIEEVNAMTAEMPGHIIAGTGAEGPTGFAMVMEFLPQDTTVAVGDPVTWSVEGPHTISFNAPESARTLLGLGEDGGYHLNPEGLMPAGFEPPEPPEGEPEAAEGTMAHEGTAPADGGPEFEGPPAIDAGTWNGEGFFNSGLMFGGDFTLRFSEPGTYNYECLIHPGMQGTITVS